LTRKPKEYYLRQSVDLNSADLRLQVDASRRPHTGH